MSRQAQLRLLQPVRTLLDALLGDFQPLRRPPQPPGRLIDAHLQLAHLVRQPGHLRFLDPQITLRVPYIFFDGGEVRAVLTDFLSFRFQLRPDDDADHAVRSLANGVASGSVMMMVIPFVPS